MSLPKNPDLSFEMECWRSGVIRVAGLDEAGRGAWAGPVTAAAVVLPADPDILSRLAGVRDSKQMTPLQRGRWAGQVRAVAPGWGVGFAACDEIDSLGIVPATRLAMQRALQQLGFTPQHLLVDALRLPQIEIPQTAILHGDARCLSIAAASVLAKTSRDAHMIELDRQFPGYSFAAHKGYGTAAHHTALRQLGVSPVHRRSFKPLRDLCGG